MRRAIDIAVALVVGVFLSVALAVLAGAVLLRMGRPVLFRQARSGLHGKVFHVVKFRTMRDERYAGEPDDLRTSRLGQVLRAWSLDELPQLWNILRGDMSLIGPRPTLPEQVARYSERDRGRLAVRPGLTGWAQVNGRNGISWRERIELDLWYLENRSVTLDARILARTALAVLRRHGVIVAGGNPDYLGTNPGSECDGLAIAVPRAQASILAGVPHPRPQEENIPPTLNKAAPVDHESTRGSEPRRKA